MITAAEDSVGFHTKKKERYNEKIQELSNEQRKIASEIDASTDPEKRIQLRSQRNKILTQLHTENKTRRN